MSGQYYVIMSESVERLRTRSNEFPLVVLESHSVGIQALTLRVKRHALSSPMDCSLGREMPYQMLLNGTGLLTIQSASKDPCRVARPQSFETLLT